MVEQMFDTNIFVCYSISVITRIEAVNDVLFV